MAKDNDNIKDLNEGEDEDLLDFDFDEDLLNEEGGKEKESEDTEEEIIELTDIAEEGHPPELVEEDIEGLEELLLDEEEGAKKEEATSEEEKEVDKLAEGEDLVSEYPSGKEEAGEETLLMKKMEVTLGEEPEPSIDLEEEFKLDEALEEIEEAVSEEGEKVVEEEVAQEPEPSIDLEEEFKLDEALEEIEEAVSEEGTGELEEPLLEEVVEKEDQAKLEPAEEILPDMAPAEEIVEEEEEEIKEEAPAISEEKIEAILTKVVSDVLERVAKEVLPEVAEKIIREEIDALKKSIIPED